MFTWLRALYATPLRLIATMMDVYAANHNRFKALMIRPKVRVVFRVAAIVTAAAWLLVFLIADDRHGERLTEFFKEFSTPSQTMSELSLPSVDTPSRVPE